MVVQIEIGSQTVAPRLAALESGRLFRTPKGAYIVQSFSGVGNELAFFRRPFERREISAEEMFPSSGDDEEGSPQVVMIRKEVDSGGGATRTRSSADPDCTTRSR